MSDDGECSRDLGEVDVETVESKVFIRPSWAATHSVSVHSHIPSPRAASPDPDDPAKLTRKEKSLGLLCKKFLDHMCAQSVAGTKIHLESTAASLGVEKRRIYDIVNVMEAMDAMSKHTKSFYVWNGLDHLPRLMAELRTIAEAEGLPERIRDVERAMCSFSLPGGTSLLADDSGIAASPDLSPTLIATRDRGARNSLSLLCRRFLMVLLCSPTENRVSLDVASTVLIKDPYTDGFEPPSRSRCRRLYDIANVLVAMGIIEKVFYLFGTKKIPLFQYCGPKPDINGPPIPVVERVPRHSVDWSDGKVLIGDIRRPSKPVARRSWGGAPLERKPSLLDMCEVACAERERIRRAAEVPRLQKTRSDLEMEEAGLALKSIIDGSSDDENKENEAPKSSSFPNSPLFPSTRVLLQQAAEERSALYQILQERTAVGLGGVVRPVPVKAGLDNAGLLPVRSPLKRRTPQKPRVITIKRPWLESPKSKATKPNVMVRVMGGSFYTPAPTTVTETSPARSRPSHVNTSTLTSGPLDLSKLGPGSFRITESGTLKRRLPLSPIKNTMRSSAGGILSPNILPLNFRPL